MRRCILKSRSKLTTVILSIVIAVFILSGSIAAPILNRSLYYSQIESLNLVERTGYSEETIRAAFDEMMDYCVGGGEDSGLEFGTGDLAWSEEGKSHFDDVARLFSMDIFILEVSLGFLLLFLFSRLLIGKDDKIGEVSSQTGHLANVAPGSLGSEKTRFLHPYRFLGRGPLFWGPVVMAALFAVLGAIASRDFDSFFVKFHHVFFPGKDNWIFYEDQDEIIRILPEEVFMNFAIVILVVLLVGCAVSIIADFVVGRRAK